MTNDSPMSGGLGGMDLNVTQQLTSSSVHPNAQNGNQDAAQAPVELAMSHRDDKCQTSKVFDPCRIEMQELGNPLIGALQHEKDGKEEASAPTDEAEYPTGLRFGLIILALSAVTVLVNLDMNIVATAVPAITDHFHTVADVGWYAAAFRLALCASQFSFGKTYSMFSIKKIFLGANIVFVLGSALCAAAISSRMLVVGRAITGLGAAGLNAGLFNILAQSTPLQVRPIWLGLATGLEGVAMLCGPLLGGILVQYAGWRWCFYINLPIGALAAILSLFCIHDKPKSAAIARLTAREKIANVDIMSNLIFVPAMITLFLALSWGGTEYRWQSGTIIGLLITTGVLLAAFVYSQLRRGDRAAIPPRLLQQRSVAAGFLFMFFMNSAGQSFEYYLPTYYQTVHGYTPSESGYLLLPFIVLGSIGAVLAGVCVSRYGYYAPFILAGTLIMTVAAGLVTTFNAHTSLAKLIAYTCIWGIGNGISFGMSSVAVQTVLPESDVPLGLSCIFFAQSFGPSLAIMIGQLIFQTRLDAGLASIGGLDVSAIDHNGLVEFIQDVPPAKVAPVLEAISKGLDGIWYLLVALAGATIFGSSLMEWKSVKRDVTQ